MLESTQTKPETKAASVTFGGCTERGARSYQEDALAWSNDARVFAVADGLGAGGGGDIAAQAAVQRAVEMATGREGWDVQRLAVDACHAADTAVRQAQSTTPGRCQTTLAVLVVDGARAAVAWVGDSRVYRFRGGELRQLTEDHRLGRHTLARCLGARNTEHSEPDSHVTDVQPGDVFALVTDGIGDTLAHSALMLALWSVGRVYRGDVVTPAIAAEELVQRAIGGGSEDNCTALVVRVGRTQ